MYSGGWDSKVYVHFEIKDDSIKKNVKSLSGHKHSVYGLLSINDDKRLVSGSEDGTVRIWLIDREDYSKC